MYEERDGEGHKRKIKEDLETEEKSKRKRRRKNMEKNDEKDDVGSNVKNDVKKDKEIETKRRGKKNKTSQSSSHQLENNKEIKDEKVNIKCKMDNKKCDDITVTVKARKVSTKDIENPTAGPRSEINNSKTNSLSGGQKHTLQKMKKEKIVTRITKDKKSSISSKVEHCDPSTSCGKGSETIVTGNTVFSYQEPSSSQLNTPGSDFNRHEDQKHNSNIFTSQDDYYNRSREDRYHNDDRLGRRPNQSYKHTEDLYLPINKSSPDRRGRKKSRHEHQQARWGDNRDEHTEDDYDAMMHHQVSNNESWMAGRSRSRDRECEKNLLLSGCLSKS